MRKLTPILIVAIAVSCFFFWQYQPNSSLPTPDNGNTIIKYGEEEEQINKRTLWFESMHRAAEGTNWRAIEHQNRLRKHQQRTTLNNSRNVLCGEELETFANEQLRGTWKERGSANQAGSVFDTEYDPHTDEIWLVSAGGTLFRGPSDGSAWMVVNQDLQFNEGLLKFIPHENGRRLLAFSGRIPHYSDDDGLTWTPASGIQHADSWGNFRSPVVLDDSLHHFYVLAKPSYWEFVTLYKSVDQGESFDPVMTFDTHDFNRFILTKPHHSNDLFLIKKTEANLGQLYSVDPLADTIKLLNEGLELDFGTARANLTAWSSDTLARLYVYTKVEEQSAVYSSVDTGQTWTHQGDLPADPWRVGMYVTPSNSDVLFMGEVDCFYSTDAGVNWERVNHWWEYYDDVAGKLHADIMHFSEFMSADSTPFLLVSHHGGLTVSEDYLISQQNISLVGLNTSQYYSVRTDPTDPNYVYAASQDQGFQVSGTFEDELREAELFEQVISGDYGHIVFSNDGQSLWTVYPGGWVTYYGSPQTSPHNHSYDLQSENETVWLPPLMTSPYPDENAIYMAGGSVNEGPGSFLIKLEASILGMDASQGSYDFLAESGGGTISAMATAPTNPDYWYVATTNGRLFYSIDGGENWDQTLNFIPEGHYLYGQTIYVSKYDESNVYLGGSGYSNPPVYKSTNNGETFQPMNIGLPSTLVFGITANSDESLLFAATENGPYVFVVADNRWYDLAGQCAPSQTYWSVEFVESINTVRFATYGRGIWDFQIDEMVNTNTLELVEQNLKVYPNPSSGLVQVEYEYVPLSGEAIPIQVFDASGQVVFQTNLNTSPMELNLSHLPKGFYSLQLNTGKGRISKKIILQ